MRKRLLLAAAGLLAVLVVAGSVVWFAPVFTVRTITVAGAEHLDAQAVADSAGVPVGANLLRVDQGQAAANVAANPWVRTVNVSRELPDQVRITLTERTAVAYLDEADGPHLIDERGQAFVIEDPPPAGAVEITGRGGDDPEVLAAVVAAVTSLDAGVREQVAAVDAQSEVEIEFSLVDGRTVYWGASEDNEAKARVMAAVITREGQHWDVSNPELATVS